MKVWSYVIASDGGCAPNYDAPAVTLVICKPKIRSQAQKAELIIAFNGKDLSRNPHSVRWAGIVSEVIAMEDYWREPRFRDKRPDGSAAPDNIYRLEDGVWIQEPNKCHEESQMKNDLRGRNALVLFPIWHFGNSQPELPEKFGLRVPENRRFERHFEIASREWLELKAWFDANDGGLPTLHDAAGCGPCVPKKKNVPASC